MANKYDLLFNSVRDLTLNIGLVAEKNDLTKGSIGVAEVLNGKVICKSIASYLANFRSQIEFKNNGVGAGLFGFSSIMNCEQRVREKDVVSEILKVEIVNGREDRKANFENSDLLFLRYDEVGSSYLFVDNNSDNPILNVYWEGGEITSEDVVFTSHVRGAVFWELVRSIQNFSKALHPKIKSINWLKFYPWFYQNHKHPRNKIIKWRYEFVSFLEENKIEENVLLGVDEFEVEFIKYLLEEKEVEHAKDVFDPYAPLVTFMEYLKG